MSAETNPWVEPEDCPHPREQRYGVVPLVAQCRLQVTLISGRVVEVCRLCWREVPR